MCVRERMAYDRPGPKMKSSTLPQSFDAPVMPIKPFPDVSKALHASGRDCAGAISTGRRGESDDVCDHVYDRFWPSSCLAHMAEISLHRKAVVQFGNHRYILRVKERTAVAP
jgi:hypothetical protein